MSLIHLARAAHHKVPEDVRSLALTKLREALRSPIQAGSCKLMGEALLATGDKNCLLLAMNHSMTKTKDPSTDNILRQEWPHGIDELAGQFWLHFNHLTPTGFFYDLSVTHSLPQNDMAASIALALTRQSHTPDHLKAVRALGIRMTADWNGSGRHQKAIEKLFTTFCDEDTIIEAYGRQNHIFGLAALLHFADKSTIVKALMLHGLQGETFSGHTAMELVSRLPKTGAWRGMTNREAGQSLRLHLAEHYPWALSRKERKAIARGKSRAGPHMANTPEAIAKRKMRAAKKKQKETETQS